MSVQEDSYHHVVLATEDTKRSDYVCARGLSYHHVVLATEDTNRSDYVCARGLISPRSIGHR